MSATGKPISVARKLLAAGVLLLGGRMLVKLLRYLRWRREVCETYPGFKPNLLLGDLPRLVELGGFNEEFFDDLHARFGHFARLFLSPTMMNLSTVDPEQALEAHKKTKSRPHETYMFMSYLGDDNLMFQHGDIVKQMRLRYGRMISNRAQLDKVTVNSYEVLTPVVDKWVRDTAAGADFDVHNDVGPAIYNIMGKTFFGSQWTDTDVGMRIFACHLHLIHNTARYMFWPFKPWFLPGYRVYAAKLQELRDLCWGLIEDHRAKMRANPDKYAGDESALTLLCSSKDENGAPFFFKGRAISTFVGFLNGAFDTTHCTTYWLVYHLARYPDVQERVRDAVRAKLGARRSGSLEDGRDIDLLDAFFRESLRYCSTVTVNQRVNYDEDVDVGGWRVPKGVNVNFPLTRIMRSKAHFGEDADTFRPERFLPDDPFYESAKRAWIAFGAHARMCIGYTFAQAELKAFLIALLQTARVSFGDNSGKETDLAARIFEAGVNQPKVHAKFRFEPLGDAGERGAQQNEASLAEWWTPPKDKNKWPAQASN